MKRPPRPHLRRITPTRALLAPLLLVGTLVGQTWDPPIVTSTSYYSARDLDMGDLDGDGNPDIVMVNGSFIPGQFAYHLGDGMGGFGSRVLVSASSACTDIVTGDLDLDGRTDVVACGTVGARVFFGTPSGPSATGVSIPILQKPVITDIDRDGCPDLVGTMSGASGCRVVFGDGQGGFPRTLNLDLTPATLPSFVHAADLDGDGGEEVVFLFERSLEYYAQVLECANGTPTLRPSISLGADSISRASLDDWDGDGFLDLLTTRNVGFEVGEVTAFHGSLLGFGPGQVVSVAPDNMRQLMVTDLDADGFLDLLATAIGGEVFSAMGIGVGAVGPWVEHQGLHYLFPALVDVTRDGVPDLVEVKSNTIETASQSGATIAGADPFGTGTPSCLGAVTINLDSTPVPGNLGMRLRFANAPPNSMGLAFGGYPHVVPGYVHELGILLHTGQELSLTVGIEPVDGSGVFSLPLPIPAYPGLGGTVVSVQGAFQSGHANGHLCGANDFGIVTSLGLVITVQ